MKRITVMRAIKGKRYKVYPNIRDAWYKSIPQGTEMTADGHNWFIADGKGVYNVNTDTYTKRIFFISDSKCELTKDTGDNTEEHY